MTKQSVQVHSKTVVAARRRRDLPPAFNPKRDCRPCFMLVCSPCFKLNSERGYKFDVHHCEEHCRHKRLRKKLSIVQGIDNRHLPRKSP